MGGRGLNRGLKLIDRKEISQATHGFSPVEVARLLGAASGDHPSAKLGGSPRIRRNGLKRYVKELS
jgi:hypothetical protein